jgi:hypothetical protein
MAAANPPARRPDPGAQDGAIARPPPAQTRFVGVDPPPQLIGLADEVRRVIDATVRVDEASPELDAIRGEMGGLAGRLEALARRGALPRMLPHVEPGPDDLRPYYPSDASRWHVNPMHPPLELHFADGVLTGRVELGLAWEGPPGHVHGAFVAMMLDPLLHEPVPFRGRPTAEAEGTFVVPRKDGHAMKFGGASFGAEGEDR